jgi:aryl-alcohol dehydrogenase-like predicted oxidoreductase
MDRRDFIKTSVAAAAIAAAGDGGLVPHAAAEDATHATIPRRKLGKTGIELSIIGLGGVVVMNTEQQHANNVVAEAVDRGVNYFDVAPSYGNAQDRLGPALKPYRNKCFLACKTGERTKEGAQRELDASLKTLETDHLDLYQFHALTKMPELNQVLGPGGAMETFVAARKAGKIRYIGFSAHSVETALAAMDRFEFDTVLFPINFVLFSQANFGPQVIEKARRKNMGILAIKAMAKTVWPDDLKKNHPNPKCWYEPADLPEQAALGLRWTLSHPITAAVPPGEEKYFRLAMDIASRYKPLNDKETATLMASAKAVEPIFKLGNS